MKIKHYTLPEHALSGQRQLTHFHFGEPGRGEKIYLQAGLHADEIPGMLVLHYLKRLLNQAERRAELRGEIILVPVANPPGLAQVVLNGGIGRFDLPAAATSTAIFPIWPTLRSAISAPMPRRPAKRTCGRSARRCARRWPPNRSAVKFRRYATIC
jgi:predicted deacylase